MYGTMGYEGFLDPFLMQQLVQNPQAAAQLDAAGIPPPAFQLTPGTPTGVPGTEMGGSLGDLFAALPFGAAMPGVPGAAGPAGASPLHQYGMQTAGVAPPVAPPMGGAGGGIGPWQTTVNPAAQGAAANPQAAAAAQVAKQIAAPQKPEYPRLIPQNAPQVSKVPDRLLLDILMAGLGPAGRGALPGGGR